MKNMASINYRNQNYTWNFLIRIFTRMINIKKMNQKDRINQAITHFVKGGDTSNVQLLDKILHDDFRVTNNGFMGVPGVTIIDKQKYLSNIKEGIFGGLPRTMIIESIE